LELYTFVADNYAPFYSLPIECTYHDASFVLDGLLDNESALEIEEHYTDTQGYTEINFAAFAMLGLRFCSGSNTGHLVPWIGAATSTPLSLSIKLVK
jgi:TnpA family transposase